VTSDLEWLRASVTSDLEWLRASVTSDLEWLRASVTSDLEWLRASVTSDSSARLCQLRQVHGVSLHLHRAPWVVHSKDVGGDDIQVPRLGGGRKH
jgi:hypothetical protein